MRLVMLYKDKQKAKEYKTKYMNEHKKIVTIVKTRGEIESWLPCSGYVL